MIFIFRVDASLEIGLGHVMRCLTFATYLKAQGDQCSFVCRDLIGNAIELIRSKGFGVHVLPFDKKNSLNEKFNEKFGRSWLGISIELDAKQTMAVLGLTVVDWLVVDHYEIGWEWEEILRPSYRNLLVIDDLANRTHSCQVLLDQNFGTLKEDYEGLVPSTCHVLVGPQYALLREDFYGLRRHSLDRRKACEFRQILVFMGGVDKDNVTGRVLDKLEYLGLPSHIELKVVLGASAPWISYIQRQIAQMSYKVELLVGINNMAEVMAESDVAIGAGGSTTWERCTLGLPALTIVVAENQLKTTTALANKGVIKMLNIKDITSEKFEKKL